MIYRGYDIERINGIFTVFENGKTVYIAKSEDDAMNWIDARKREQRK